MAEQKGRTKMGEEKAGGAARGKARDKLTIEQRRRIFCVKNGHSRLRDYFFGYHQCARCGDQLGDSLGGAYSDDTAVYVTHMHRFTHDGEMARGCKCPENAKKLTKKDCTLVPQWTTFGNEQRPPWRERGASTASAPKEPPDPPEGPEAQRG